MSDWFTYWKTSHFRKKWYPSSTNNHVFLQCHEILSLMHLESCMRLVSFYLRNCRALASATPQIKNVISPLGKEACCTCDTHFRIIPLCRFLENNNVKQSHTGSGSQRHLQLRKVNCKCFWLSIEIATKYELSWVNERALSGMFYRF